MSAWSEASPEARYGLFLFAAFLGIGAVVGAAVTLFSLRFAGVL